MGKNPLLQLTPDQKLTLGERLRELRGGRSVEDVADHCAVSAVTIRKIESGENAPSLASALAIARALKVPLKRWVEVLG